MSTFLSKSYQIKQLDLKYFSGNEDEGEGEIILLALASSNSLPTISHFVCGRNSPWFSNESKERSVELLCDAIRAMTNLQYLDLSYCRFETENKCDQVVSAIIANKEQNPSLADINLFCVGAKDHNDEQNSNFSSSAKEHIAALKAKGLTIAETKELLNEMNKRYC